MKVKKFRIRPRLGLVARTLKSKMGVKSLSQEVEDQLAAEGEALFRHAAPSALYKTWHGEQIPPQLRGALVQAGRGKAIAVSAVAATIGASVEETLSGVLMEGETNRSQIISGLCEEGAEQAFNFIFKLLTEDAKSDDCDVSDPLFLSDDPDLLTETLNSFGSDNDEIHLDGASHVSPRFTRIALVGWVPASRKRKLAASSKKK